MQGLLRSPQFYRLQRTTVYLLILCQPGQSKVATRETHSPASPAWPRHGEILVHIWPWFVIVFQKIKVKEFRMLTGSPHIGSEASNAAFPVSLVLVGSVEEIPPADCYKQSIAESLLPVCSQVPKSSSS